MILTDFYLLSISYSRLFFVNKIFDKFIVVIIDRFTIKWITGVTYILL